MLAERGRIEVSGDPHSWVRQMAEAVPRREAALTHDIDIVSHQLDLVDVDPADRFLAATARVLNLTLVTADERLLRSADFESMPNA